MHYFFMGVICKDIVGLCSIHRLRLEKLTYSESFLHLPIDLWLKWIFSDFNQIWIIFWGKYWMLLQTSKHKQMPDHHRVVGQGLKIINIRGGLNFEVSMGRTLAQ